MGLRTIVALLLGLFIQLSQMPLRGSESSTCRVGAKRVMSCCDPAEPCPCASKGDPDRKPLPLKQGGVEGKSLVLARASEPELETKIASCGAAAKLRCVVREDHPAGYSGVTLAVAYCSFVI